jgi:hypothetical protein
MILVANYARSIRRHEVEKTERSKRSMRRSRADARGPNMASRNSFMNELSHEDLRRSSTCVICEMETSAHK